ATGYRIAVTPVATVGIPSAAARIAAVIFLRFRPPISLTIFLPVTPVPSWKEYLDEVLGRVDEANPHADLAGGEPAHLPDPRPDNPPVQAQGAGDQLHLEREQRARLEDTGRPDHHAGLGDVARVTDVSHFPGPVADGQPAPPAQCLRDRFSRRSPHARSSPGARGHYPFPIPAVLSIRGSPDTHLPRPVRHLASARGVLLQPA